MNVKTAEISAPVRYGYTLTLPPKFSAWLRTVRSDGRRNIFSVAASRVSELVRRHLSAASASRHATADRLGANHTGFLEEGARSGVTPHATPNEAEVLIRVPGIQRAFAPLTIAPRAASSLTIPVDSLAYGRRVAEVRALGWNVFRPKGKDVLMGEKDGETRGLYALRKRVTLKQDRGLLPTDEAIGTAAKLSIRDYLQRRFAA